MNKIKTFTQDVMDNMLQTAAGSERGRINLNWHEDLADPVQRFYNAMQPDTYVRPHRHTTPPRWEFFLVLQGHLVLLLFDDSGVVIERKELKAGGDTVAVEIPAGTWHAIAAFEPSVMFELKEGPYSKLSDKDFAAWAPDEGDVQCGDLVGWYKKAGLGEIFGS